MSEKQVKILSSSIGTSAGVYHPGEVLTVSEAVAESWVDNKLAVYEPPLIQTPEDNLPNLGTPEDEVPPVDNPEGKLPDVKTPEDDAPPVETAGDKPAEEEAKPKTKRTTKTSK